MKLTPLVKKAIVYAADLHRDQRRKSEDVPYVVHPFTVMLLLSEHTDNETLLAAALLHDVLEDVPGYREADMRRDFGDAVTDLVLEVSEKKDPNREYDKRGTWRERKEGYLAGLRQDSQEAVMLSAADRIHNLSDLNEHLERNGLAELDKYNAGADQQRWFFGEVAAVVSERLGDHPLARRLAAEVERFRRLAA